MKIKTKELLSILEMLRPGVDTKDIVESMTYYLFSGTDVITYNNKISIQHPFETDFSLFVKANDLYKLLTKTTVETITLSENNEKLNVSSKKFKANLSTIKDEEVSTRIANVANSLKNANWHSLPDNFCPSISLCSFTASTQESDGTMTCVNVDGVDCTASDNNRISHAVLNSDVDAMLIKASEIRNLVAIVPIEYAITKSWLHFKNKENCIFSIRKITGKFPEFIQFFDFTGSKIKLPSDIIEGVDITSIFMNAVDSAINFKIKDNLCIISIESDNGKVQHRSKLKYKGDEIAFAINPDFLREMMTHSSTITLSDDKAKLQTENGFELLTALFG